MSIQSKQIAEMIDMLPEQEKLLAWDPDYTKLTRREVQELEAAEKDEYIDEKDIDWNDLLSFK